MVAHAGFFLLRYRDREVAKPALCSGIAKSKVAAAQSSLDDLPQGELMDFLCDSSTAGYIVCT